MNAHAPEPLPSLILGIVVAFLLAWGIPHYLVGVLLGRGRALSPAAQETTLFARRFLDATIWGLNFYHQFDAFVTTGRLVINVSLGGRNICEISRSSAYRIERRPRGGLRLYDIVVVSWWRDDRQSTIALRAWDLSQLVDALRSVGIEVADHSSWWRRQSSGRAQGGMATELEAASPPAGRGVEPEAVPTPTDLGRE